MAFVANWDGDWEIYRVQADGSGLSQLTMNQTTDADVQWSPDGTKVAYVADIVSNPRLNIVDISDLAESSLAPDVEVSSGLVWTPSGDSIVFRSVDDLYSVDVDSGVTALLVAGITFGPGLPSFSPDGSKMVLTASMFEGTPAHRMYLANADGSGQAELRFPEGDALWPEWHPFNGKILFQGETGSDGTGIYVATPNGSISKLGINEEYRPALPAWSPDGSMIAYLVSDSPPAIGGTVRHSLRVRIEDLDVDAAVISPAEDPKSQLNIARYSWGPDSRHIALILRDASNESSTQNLAVLDICSGTSKLVAMDVASPFAPPSWRPIR